MLQMHKLYVSSVQFSSVAQSCPTLCNPINCSMPGLSPSPAPGVDSDSCPSSRWCHPAISSSVVPFSSCPQSFPASESFPMSQLFPWSGQSTGVSASASFPPKKSQGWSPSEWTGWISLQSKGLSRVFSNLTVQKHQFFGAQLSSQSNSHIVKLKRISSGCRNKDTLSSLGRAVFVKQSRWKPDTIRKKRWWERLKRGGLKAGMS